MRQRYRLYRRKSGGRYYIHDDLTGKQDSLHTTDRATALRLFHSRKEAQQQPAVNLQIARAYLAASDPHIATRNWQYVMEEMVKLKTGETQHRWQTAKASHSTATATPGRNEPRPSAIRSVSRRSLGPQQQGSASRLRKTCPDENSIAGGLRTTGSGEGRKLNSLCQ